MQRAGIDTTHAEALLYAYREGARLAQEQRQLLHTRFALISRAEER